jgi:hypothetical protein
LCNDGYYIGSNGLCIVLASLCSTYDQSTGLCITCPSGYALFSGVCWNLAQPAPPNPWCSSYNGNFCVDCYDGWYLSAQICVPANPWCLTYDMNSGACLTCPLGYYLSGVLCLVANPLCVTYDANDYCLTCP